MLVVKNEINTVSSSKTHVHHTQQIYGKAAHLGQTWTCQWPRADVWKIKWNTWLWLKHFKLCIYIYLFLLWTSSPSWLLPDSEEQRRQCQLLSSRSVTCFRGAIWGWKEPTLTFQKHVWKKEKKSLIGPQVTQGRPRFLTLCFEADSDKVQRIKAKAAAESETLRVNTSTKKEVMEEK